MSQILFSWGPLVVPAYGFFVGLAIVLGMALSERRGRELGLPPFGVLDIAFVAALGGILGADIFHFAFAGGNLPGHGGRSFFGSLLGGSLSGLAFARWRGFPLLKTMDCFFLYAPLSHAVGLIGFWFYGCCHGRVCAPDSALAVWFPKLEIGGGRLVGSPAFVRHLNQGLVESGQTHSLPVYPTQLFSALLLVGVFITLRSLSTRPAVASRGGAVVCLYLLLSGAARFTEEFFRDHTRYLGLLTNAQIVSLLTFAIAAVGLSALMKRPPETSMRRKSRPARNSSALKTRRSP